MLLQQSQRIPRVKTAIGPVLMMSLRKLKKRITVIRRYYMIFLDVVLRRLWKLVIVRSKSPIDLEDQDDLYGCLAMRLMKKTRKFKYSALCDFYQM